MSFAQLEVDLLNKSTKAGLAGGIAAAASYFMGEAQGSISLLGVNVPIPVAIFGAVGASSIAADLGHDWVLPHIPGNATWTNVESAALGLGLSGGTTSLILNRELGQPTVNFFVLGAGSYVAADYILNKWKGASSDFGAFY